MTNQNPEAMRSYVLRCSIEKPDGQQESIRRAISEQNLAHALYADSVLAAEFEMMWRELVKEFFGLVREGE